MKIDKFNVDMELRIQIKEFLNGPVNYIELRHFCLTDEPVSPIVKAISAKLDRLALDDKSLYFQKVIQEAYEMQCRLDIQEENRDKGQLLALQWDIEDSLETILDREKKLEAKIKEEEALTKEISKLQQVRINRPIPAESVNHHEHPSEVTAAENITIEVMLPTLQQVNQDIRMLHLELSGLQRSLAALYKQQEVFKMRHVNRENRASWRVSEHLSLTKIESLSKTNADKLNLTIQNLNTNINAVLKAKKHDTNKKCHFIFISQLHLMLDQLKIEPEEKVALEQLIIKLKAYYLLVQEKIPLERGKLEGVRCHIIKIQKQIQDANHCRELLCDENTKLEEANQGTNEDLSQKLSQLSEFKSYMNYGIVCSLFILISLISGCLLLDAATLAMPVVAVSIGVVTYALVALICFTVMFAIQTYSLKSMIESDELARQTKAQLISNSIKNLTNETLPQLKDNLRDKMNEMQVQQLEVDHAERAVRILLMEAEEITPLTLNGEKESIMDSGNPYLFYTVTQSSAPSAIQVLEAANVPTSAVSQFEATRA